MLEDISNFESPIDAQNLKKHPCSGAYYVFLSTLLNHRHPISSQTQTPLGKSEHQFGHILSLNFCIIVHLLWLDCPSHAPRRSGPFCLQASLASNVGEFVRNVARRVST